MPHRRQFDSYEQAETASSDPESDIGQPVQRQRQKRKNKGEGVSVVLAVLVAVLAAILCIVAARVLLQRFEAPVAASSSSSKKKPLCRRRRMQERTWWRPSSADSFVFDIENEELPTGELGSEHGVRFNASVYVVDLFEASVGTIERYRQSGRRVACLFSAGTWESWRYDARTVMPSCLCRCSLDGRCLSESNHLEKDHERWFDVRKEECMEEVKAMQWKRIDFAARKGCDAVVPDNLSPSDVTYALWISDTAHSFGLAFGLKNSIELLHSHFAISVSYIESDAGGAYEDAHIPHVNIEYGLVGRRACDLAALHTVQYSDFRLDHRKINMYCKP